jgi:hypothetical protein
MTGPITVIINDLNALEPGDFDLNYENSNGRELLYALAEEVRNNPQSKRAIQALFDLLERFPDPTASLSLGSPGPIVHTLEKLDYEYHLLDSLKRKPTTYTVHMVNRIINSLKSKRKRKFWINQLDLAVNHPRTSRATKVDAQDYKNFQLGKSVEPPLHGTGHSPCGGSQRRFFASNYL